jgi:NADH:ubiquinone oxidoreductase subunit 2 (subunit N)
MVITLIIALISTLFYINILITEIYNSKQFRLEIENKQNNNLTVLIKIILIILMGIFWGITIRFW